MIPNDASCTKRYFCSFVSLNRFITLVYSSFNFIICLQLQYTIEGLRIPRIHSYKKLVHIHLSLRWSVQTLFLLSFIRRFPLVFGTVQFMNDCCWGDIRWHSFRLFSKFPVLVYLRRDSKKINRISVKLLNIVRFLNLFFWWYSLSLKRNQNSTTLVAVSVHSQYTMTLVYIRKFFVVYFSITLRSFFTVWMWLWNAECSL